MYVLSLLNRQSCCYTQDKRLSGTPELFCRPHHLDIFSQVVWQPKRVWTACNETQFQMITNFSEEWQDKIKICNDLLYKCICVTQYVCSTCQHSMKILRRLYRGITQYFHSRGPGRPSFSWLGQGGLSGEYGS